VDDVHLGAICADFDLNFLNGLAATLAGDDFAFIVDSRSGILLGASESSIDIIKYYSYSSYAMNYVNNIAENELYGLVDDWVSERYGNQQGNLAWQYGNITDDTATDQIIASTGGEYFLQMSTYSQNGLRFSIFKLIDADKIVGQVVASRDLTIVIVTFLALIIILVQVATGIWLDRLTFDQNSLKALLQALENKWNESRNITRGLKQDIRVSRLLQWVWHLKTPIRSQDTKHAGTIDDVIELAGVYMGWSSPETKTNAATLKNTQLYTGSRVGSRISSTGNNGNSAAKTLLFNVSAMMSSPVTSGIFKMATLDSSHSSENVSFLEIVHDYHDSDAKERKRLAPIITRLFIEDGSPLELNVSSRLKDKIMSETFRANDNLYKPAVKEIVRLLATNSRKFFRTGAFSACEQLADMYKKHGAMYVSRSNNRSTTENSWFGTKASRLHSKLSSKRTESETASFFGDSRQSYNEDRGSGSTVGSDTGSISMESANVHPHSTIVAPADLDTIEESGPGPVPTLHTPQEQEQPDPDPPHGERNAE
jgi:hypothetical protein